MANIHYLNECYEEAIEILETKIDFTLVEISYLSTETFFYGFLSYSAFYSNFNPNKQQKASKAMSRYYKKIKKRDAHCDCNTRHLCHLMEAELAALKGKTIEAIRSYKAGIEFADKVGYYEFRCSTFCSKLA